MDSGRFIGGGLFLALLASGTPVSAQPPGSEASSETQNSHPAPAQPSGKAVKTSLEMKVRGVLAIGDGDDRRSSAIIVTKGGSQGKAYSPGQLIDDNPDLKLLRVYGERIEFLNRGQLEFAPVKRFPDGGSSGSSPMPPASSATDSKIVDGPSAPRGKPFRRSGPPRRSGAEGQDDAIAPASPDGQPASDLQP